MSNFLFLCIASLLEEEEEGEYEEESVDEEQGEFEPELELEPGGTT